MAERGFIVVGVDGTRESDAALAFALDEAARTGDAVEVVTAWTVRLPPVSVPVIPPVVAMTGTPLDERELRTQAEEFQEQALARMAGAAATVTVSRRVVEGDAAQVLVDASRTARMLVVGSRAMGAVRAALLGSVSRHCAHHAACPVVVVPDPVQVDARESEAPPRTPPDGEPTP